MMTRLKNYKSAVVIGVLLLTASFAFSQASSIPSSELIQPEELAKIIQSSTADKPLLIHVGFHVLYLQAHIPKSEYFGPGSDAAAIERLRGRVKSLPKDKSIVIYCGCCPWDHCPNIKPAHDALRAMGFTNVKALYVADNFGTNWRDKGYPTTKGE